MTIDMLSPDISKDPRLLRQVDEHPYPLLFATISGAHLYGFPSPDSDFDLRGVHLLKLDEIVGLKNRTETIEKSGIRDGLEMDLVTHDLEKFLRLMLRRNGYVLEQLLSPLVVYSSEAHAELKSLAPRCITRNHAHHYMGFAATQWRLFEKETPPRVKPLLYVFRVLLTGIHLMRTGQVEANLSHLNHEAKLPYIPDLMERKIRGPERGTLSATETSFYHSEYLRLMNELEGAHRETFLPETTDAADAINDFLVRIRLAR